MATVLSAVRVVERITGQSWGAIRARVWSDTGAGSRAAMRPIPSAPASLLRE